MSGWQITGPCPTNWRGTRVPVSQNIKPRRTYSGSDKSEKIRQIWENRTRGQIWQMFTQPETTLRSHVNKIIIHLITIWHCYFHDNHQGLFSFCTIKHKVGRGENKHLVQFNNMQVQYQGSTVSGGVLPDSFVPWAHLFCRLVGFCTWFFDVSRAFYTVLSNLLAVEVLYWRVHNSVWPVLTILFWLAFVGLGLFGIIIIYLCSHYSI